MIYYKVRKVGDNRRLFTKNRRRYVGFLIANELYTQREYNRLVEKCGERCTLYFSPVEVSKNKIYFFFGARFGMEV